MLTRKQLAELRRRKDGPNRVGAAMEMAGLTQVQVAQKIGCTQPNVSRIVTGQYTGALDTTRALAELFGCHIEDLFPSREAVAS